MSLKRILILFISAISMLPNAFAQPTDPDDGTSGDTAGDKIAEERTPSRFGAQILLGFNAAQIDGDGMAGYNKFGLNAGIRGIVHIRPKFDASVEIQYNQRGAALGLRDYNSTLRSINLDYAEIPIMAHYRDWRFQVGAGLSYGRLLNVKVTDIGGADLTDALIKDLKTYDISYVLAGNLFFNKHLAANMQFSRSFINLLKSDSNLFRNYAFYSNNLFNSYYFTMRLCYQL